MFFYYDAHNCRFDISLDESLWLESAMITSLFTYKKLAESPEYGWWAEDLTQSSVGSRLHTLKREKLTDEILELSQQYALEALTWLEERQLISDFQILSKAKGNVLLIEVTSSGVHQPRKVVHAFQLPVP